MTLSLSLAAAAPQEVLMLRFKAKLERLVIPGSGALSISLPLGSQISGKLHVNIPDSGSKEAVAGKTQSGASMWVQLIRKTEITGNQINATFQNSTFYAGYDKIAALHHPYNNSLISCTGPDNPCKSSGTQITLSEGNAKAQVLRPTGFRLICEQSGGVFGDKFDLTVRQSVEKLLHTADPERTYLILYFSESPNAHRMVSRCSGG